MHQEDHKAPLIERKAKQILALDRVCAKCVICPLGQTLHDHRHMRFDPHVLSTLEPSKWMVVGQNPGATECIRGEPFVGDAGKNFNKELAKYKFERSKFYITNTVKCHTPKNEKPDANTVKQCAPFLQMELNILRPKLVVTLGAVAFDYFCPELIYSKSRGQIIKSKKFGVKIYPIYHPSPQNLAVVERRQDFEQQIRNLCGLIAGIEKGNNGAQMDGQNNERR